jgi:hypothetical protein
MAQLPYLAAVALLGLVVAIVPATARVAARQAPPRIDVSTRAMVGALTRYVAEYQRQFALLVADEEYTQELRTTAGEVSVRRMRGELFLTYLESDGEWSAVHDFTDVDGTPVEDREDLRSLLRAGSMQSIARRLADRNARFNLGRVTRNFNDPTVALLVAGAKRAPNVRFDVEGVDRSDPSDPIVTLAFRERDRPTLVRSVQGQPVYARGVFVVEAATGRVRQTRITFDRAPVVAEMDTTYVVEPRLGIWVPSEWHERYTLSVGREREVVTGESIYSNYRRFEVSGRIKGGALSARPSVHAPSGRR